MPPSTSSREALLACPPSPPWNFPSFTMKSTLSYPCFFLALIPLLLAKVRLLPILTFSSLMIWYCGQTAHAADALARRGALLVPSAILCSLSPFVSRIHSSLFSDWRRTVSSKFLNTQVPSISTEELVLPVCLQSLVYTLESCPASGAPWSSAMAPYLGRGGATNNNLTLHHNTWIFL